MNVIGSKDLIGMHAKVKPKIKEAIIRFRKGYANLAYLITSMRAWRSIARPHYCSLMDMVFRWRLSKNRVRANMLRFLSEGATAWMFVRLN